MNFFATSEALIATHLEAIYRRRMCFNWLLLQFFNNLITTSLLIAKRVSSKKSYLSELFAAKFKLSYY